MALYEKDDGSVSPVDCVDRRRWGWRRPCLHKGTVHIVYALHNEVKGPLLISGTQQARSQLSNTEPSASGV